MPPAIRRSKRLQTVKSADLTQGTRKSTRTGIKRKAPEYSSSDSDEELPDPKAPLATHLPITPLDPAKNPPPNETTPGKITQPLAELIHPALTSSWTINPSMNMCFIFDVISPARQFKRGTKDDDSIPFPAYNDAHLSDVTETDGVDTSWIQYMPKKYK